jgi:hypothetical protein
MFKKTILSAVFILCSSTVNAGGSFLMEDIRPILDQSPVVRNFLISTLDFEKSGDANRIGNNVNPRLGGTRLGPYCVPAKPKGKTGRNTMIVCIITEYIFRDKAGKICKLEQAYSVNEKFISLDIKPADD